MSIRAKLAQFIMPKEHKQKLIDENIRLGVKQDAIRAKRKAIADELRAMDAAVRNAEAPGGEMQFNGRQ